MGFGDCGVLRAVVEKLVQFIAWCCVPGKANLHTSAPCSWTLPSLKLLLCFSRSQQMNTQMFSSAVRDSCEENVKPAGSRL